MFQVHLMKIHIELSQQHHIPILSQSPQFSSSLHNPTTMPIQIPTSTSSNTGIPPASLPHLTGLFPITQSHSLPTYFIPQGNLAYFITNTNQHSTQPLHIITPLNPHSLQYSKYTLFNIIISTNKFINESLSLLQNKRHDNDDNKKFNQWIQINNLKNNYHLKNDVMLVNNHLYIHQWILIMMMMKHLMNQ